MPRENSFFKKYNKKAPQKYAELLNAGMAYGRGSNEPGLSVTTSPSNSTGLSLFIL